MRSWFSRRCLLKPLVLCPNSSSSLFEAFHPPDPWQDPPPIDLLDPPALPPRWHLVGLRPQLVVHIHGSGVELRSRGE